nr:uncharacterized protein LOC111422931 [Onthophagus taurus]
MVCQHICEVEGECGNCNGQCPISQHVSYEENTLKSDLVRLVKENATSTSYVVDELVKNSSCFVLLLPPYHCELNPIELIWAQIKGYAARANNTFKISDVLKLFHEALTHVSTEDWKKSIEHVKKKEEEMWMMDSMYGSNIQPLIIHLEEEGDDDDEGAY